MSCCDVIQGDADITPTVRDTATVTYGTCPPRCKHLQSVLRKSTASHALRLVSTAAAEATSYYHCSKDPPYTRLPCLASTRNAVQEVLSRTPDVREHHAPWERGIGPGHPQLTMADDASQHVLPRLLIAAGCPLVYICRLGCNIPTHQHLHVQEYNHALLRQPRKTRFE